MPDPVNHLSCHPPMLADISIANGLSEPVFSLRKWMTSGTHVAVGAICVRLQNLQNLRELWGALVTRIPEWWSFQVPQSETLRCAHHFIFCLQKICTYLKDRNLGLWKVSRPKVQCKKKITMSKFPEWRPMMVIMLVQRSTLVWSQVLGKKCDGFWFKRLRRNSV